MYVRLPIEQAASVSRFMLYSRLTDLTLVSVVELAPVDEKATVPLAKWNPSSAAPPKVGPDTRALTADSDLPVKSAEIVAYSPWLAEIEREDRHIPV